MTTHRIGQLGIALSVTLTLCCAWIAPVDGQTSPVVRLKDGARTELQVARDRARALKEPMVL